MLKTGWIVALVAAFLLTAAGCQWKQTPASEEGADRGQTTKAEEEKASALKEGELKKTEPAAGPGASSLTLPVVVATPGKQGAVEQPRGRVADEKQVEKKPAASAEENKAHTKTDSAAEKKMLGEKPATREEVKNTDGKTPADKSIQREAKGDREAEAKAEAESESADIPAAVLEPITVPEFTYPEFTGKKIAVIHTANVNGELKPSG